MEICKFVKNQYPDMDSVFKVINYIFDSRKTYGCIGSVSTCIDHCINEIYLVKKYFNKLGGQNLIHIVISTPSFENMEDDELYKLAFYISSYFGSRYQAIFGIHFKESGYSESTHIHLAVNTVSFVDGYKLSASYDLKAAFRKFVNQSIKLFMKNNLTFQNKPTHLSDTFNREEN